MASILYKWFFVVSIITFTSFNDHHPLYVSVTEIEHNSKDKTLEISCKLYTDDFEKTLRKTFNTHIDLVDPKLKNVMDKYINEYVQKHINIKLEGKLANMHFLGYEQIEEGIYCYFQVDHVTTVKNLAVKDNLLYDYKSEQISLIHVTVNGNRKSTKLVNPDEDFSFVF